MLTARTPFLLLSFLLASGLGLAVGCDGGEKAKKMEECSTKAKDMKDADECKKCCEDAGASGHSYMSLDETTCTCNG